MNHNNIQIQSLDMNNRIAHFRQNSSVQFESNKVDQVKNEDSFINGPIVSDDIAKNRNIHQSGPRASKGRIKKNNNLQVKQTKQQSSQQIQSTQLQRYNEVSSNRNIQTSFTNRNNQQQKKQGNNQKIQQQFQNSSSIVFNNNISQSNKQISSIKKSEQAPIIVSGHASRYFQEKNCLELIKSGPTFVFYQQIQQALARNSESNWWCAVLQVSLVLVQILLTIGLFLLIAIYTVVMWWFIFPALNTLNILIKLLHLLNLERGRECLYASLSCLLIIIFFPFLFAYFISTGATCMFISVMVRYDAYQIWRWRTPLLFQRRLVLVKRRNVRSSQNEVIYVSAEQLQAQPEDHQWSKQQFMCWSFLEQTVANEDKDLFIYV